MDQTDFHYRTLIELAGDSKERRVSSVAVTHAILSRIAEFDPELIERDKFRGRLIRLFRDVDAIALPVSTNDTPTWQEANALIEHDVEALMRFTTVANAAGIPAVTLPCGLTSDGRSVGFQLIGPHCSEASLLRIAHAYQQSTDWHIRRPQGFGH